jgi:hypothetical protein
MAATTCRRQVKTEHCAAARWSHARGRKPGRWSHRAWQAAPGWACPAGCGACSVSFLPALATWAEPPEGTAALPTTAPTSTGSSAPAFAQVAPARRSQMLVTDRRPDRGQARSTRPDSQDRAVPASGAPARASGPAPAADAICGLWRHRYLGHSAAGRETAPARLAEHPDRGMCRRASMRRP